jgi:hypothetical protein
MDAHITEPVDLWLRYVDAPYRDMAPREQRDAHFIELALSQAETAVRIGQTSFALWSWMQTES